MAGQDYEEKRNYQRIKVKSALNYSIVGQSASYPGISEDISGDGLAICSMHQPAVGDPLSITLPSASEQVAPLQAQGTVVRVQRHPAQPEAWLISVALHQIQ